MASTYSNLKIQLMQTGENSTTWGDVTNVNFGTALEEAITGSADVPFSSADVTLTLSNTNGAQTARNLRLNLTGTSGGARFLYLSLPSVDSPTTTNIEKAYIINNGLADAVTVRNKINTVAAGASVVVPAGKTMWVYDTGTDIVDVTTHLTSLTLATALPVLSGGTGAATASGARLNLDTPSTSGSGATGTWGINITGSAASATTATTANGLNASNTYTVAGLNSTGLLECTTPNSGTSGGIVLRGNATSGNAILQVRDSTGVSQWGFAVVTVAGTFTWSGQITGSQFNGSGAGLTGTASSLSIGGNAATATNATNATNVTGTVAVANGGTGATDAATARTNLGAGTVTSVAGAGTVNGLTLTGTVTSSGNLTLGGTLSGVSLTTQVSGTLPVANGGTGATDAATARTNLGAAASGANTDITALDQDVTITATGTIAADTLGFRGLPQNSQTATYTLALSDAGKHISITTGGVVIPANGSVAFPIGTTIVIFNNSGSSQNISITTDTLRQAGTANTGTRALAQYGLATCVKVASTTWVISGVGVS